MTSCYLDAKSMARLGLLVLLALGLGPALAQGDSGFLRGEGKLDFSLSFSTDAYDQFWIGSNVIDDAPFGEVLRQTTSIYAAYGVREDMDISVGASSVYVTTDAVFEKESDLQDIAFQFKWRFFSKNMGPGTLNLLFAPSLKLPMSNYENNGVPALGDGQTDIRLHGVAQYLLPSGAFIALDSGYGFRFEEPPNELLVSLTGGVTVFNRLTFTGFFSTIESMGGYDIGQGPFPGVEEEYDRIGGGFYLRLNDAIGVSGSAWSTRNGKNTGDVDGVSLSLIFRS